MQKYAGLYVKYAEVYFTFMIYMHSPLPLCWWVWGPSIGVALVSPCLIVTAAIARVWIMGFVSGRLSQPCLALGRWNPSQPGPCDSSESPESEPEPNEGLHCQFTEWRIALSKLSEYAFWSAKQLIWPVLSCSSPSRNRILRWKRNLRKLKNQLMWNGQAVGQNLHLYLIFVTAWAIPRALWAAPGGAAWYNQL